MNKFKVMARELRSMAGKRHKDRYGPKPISNAQLGKRLKEALQSILQLTSIPESDLPLDWKSDLEAMQQRLIEMHKTLL